jgi:HSP90 family molecular chaperone
MLSRQALQTRTGSGLQNKSIVKQVLHNTNRKKRKKKENYPNTYNEGGTAMKKLEQA